MRKISLPCGNCGSSNCNYCNIMRPFPALPDAHDTGAGENFSVIVPYGATNLLNNPTPFAYPSGPGPGEITTYGSIGTSIVSLQSGYGNHGPFGVRVLADNSSGGGINIDNGFTGSILQAGEKYIFCADHKAAAGSTWQIGVRHSSGAPVLSSDTFVATGNWQRVCVIHREQITTQRSLFIRKFAPNPTNQEWQAASFQLERGTIATTFLDGYGGGAFDWPGLNSADFIGAEKYFTWDSPGIPYRSASTRGRFTRAGGLEVKLADCGFEVSGYGGLGFPVTKNIFQPYAALDGGFWKGALYTNENIFTITGRFHACNLSELHKMRACLLEMFADCSAKYRDQMIIRYTPRDNCGNQCGDPADIICRYTGGLEGAITSTIEEITLQFQMSVPFVRSAYQRDYQNVIAVSNGIPNATSNLTLKYAICNRGNTYTQPVFIMAGNFDLDGMTITNDDTGQQIVMSTQTPTYEVNFTPSPTSELIIINTAATVASVLSTLNGNLTGRMEVCSNLADFELACGWNHLTITIRNLQNPNFNVLDPSNISGYKPFFRLAFREQYLGIDSIALCNDGDNDCDLDLVRAGYTVLN